MKTFSMTKSHKPTFYSALVLTLLADECPCSPNPNQMASLVEPPWVTAIPHTCTPSPALRETVDPVLSPHSNSTYLSSKEFKLYYNYLLNCASFYKAKSLEKKQHALFHLISFLKNL